MLLVLLLQYLSDMCGPCSLAELKAFLENRQRIRTQLIEDLRKKRKCRSKVGQATLLLYTAAINGNIIAVKVLYSPYVLPFVPI